MAELRWKTPVPLPGLLPMSPENTQWYLIHLARWLLEQERGAEYNLEDDLAFGGPDVANRIVGFEEEHSEYSAPDEVILLTGPAAPGKFIVIGLHIATTEAAESLLIYVRKDTTDCLIATLNPDTGLDKDVIGGSGGAGPITLDAPDEKIVIKTHTDATGDYGWAGSYVNVE